MGWFILFVGVVSGFEFGRCCFGAVISGVGNGFIRDVFVGVVYVPIVYYLVSNFVVVAWV